MNTFSLYKHTAHIPYVVINNKRNTGCAFNEIGDIVFLNIRDWISGSMQNETILLEFNDLEEIEEKYPEEFI